MISLDVVPSYPITVPSSAFSEKQKSQKKTDEKLISSHGRYHIQEIEVFVGV